MVKLVKHDLEFILKQIKIAEANSAAHSGTDAVELLEVWVDIHGNPFDEDGNPYLPNTPGTQLALGSPLLPFGLRTVDGSYNNLVPGREQWGASDEFMPRLLEQGWRIAEPGIDGPGAPPGFPGSDDTTSYEQESGWVVDSQPRVISNLIADQTLGNPAAIVAALQHAESEDLLGDLARVQEAYADYKAAKTAVQDAEAAVAAAEAALNEASTQVPLDIDAIVAAAQLLLQQQQLLGQQEPLLEAAEAELEEVLEDVGIEMDMNGSVIIPNVAPDEGLSAPFNAWMTFFGQFFDHGLDLVNKGGNDTIYIPLKPDDPLYVEGSHTNFMVLTRATQHSDPDDPDARAHVNQTTPHVDQNQTYTSHPSHQVFLREYVLVDGVPLATGRMLGGENGGLATWADVKTQARDILGIELTDMDVLAVPMVLVDPYGEFIRGDNGFPILITAVGEVEGNLDEPISTEFAVRAGRAFLDDIAHGAVPNGNGYDVGLLEAHFITGDGRGNENIGLTAVHHIFHSEHNRMVAHTKEVVFGTGDLAFINEWLLQPISEIPSDLNALAWDGERLFQAARFVTEMQYQHLVFEEFARKMQPFVDIFDVMPDVEINPAIFAEFAHVVYRFGHSMLNESVARINNDGTDTSLSLIEAFLDPLGFASGYNGDHDAAAGAIIRGLTRQTGNEIDEFVTGALRNNLVGLPLDLAAINIARGRDTGIPSLNEARDQFYKLTGDSNLRPYTSWADFGLHLKNPASLINFIAAYGTHVSITMAETVEDKRAAAFDLVFATDGSPSDRLAFLNATGDYAQYKGGLDLVDLWIGGLAEKTMPFGGMLGSTFNFVFELQMENLQDGDRFYYLARLQGTNLLSEMENNSFAAMIMRNTDIGESGMHLPGDIFSSPDYILELDQSKQLHDDPVHDDPFLQAFSNKVERGDNYLRFNGEEHVVLGGTSGNDTLIGGDGDDTIWGGAGDDRIEGGYGNDILIGGDGDDIITDMGGDDNIKGGDGNDVIHGGGGLDLIMGGDGDDFIMTGHDGSEVFGGEGNDFIAGGDGIDTLFGGGGDDWIEGGGRFDYIAGDHGDLFFNSTVIGHDVLNGGGGDTDYDADSGDDIMFAGEGIQKFIGMWGFDWVIHKGQNVGATADMNIEIFPTLPIEVVRDRFSQVEALSGWKHDDILRGDNRTADGADDDMPGIPDPTPEGNFMYNELDEAGIARIHGLDQIITEDLLVEGRYWADGSGDWKEIFIGGNILLGGGGSDTIEGRGGDDIIDGDAWLNVRIAIQFDFDDDRYLAPDYGGDGLYWADGMFAQVYAWDNFDDVTGTAENAQNAAFGGMTLDQLMLGGRLNPGWLTIHREILYNPYDLDGQLAIDTAVYWDDFANYTITELDDGWYEIRHDTFDDSAIDPDTGKHRFSDGTDRVRNIELLEFDGETRTIDEWLAVQALRDDDNPPPVVPELDDEDEADDTPDGNVQVGTPGNNTIFGTAGNDIIIGEEGDDRIFGEDGDDILIGGAGNDVIFGGDGDDIIWGGAGDDIVFGGAGDDMFVAEQGDGNDTYYGGDGNDTLDMSSITADITADLGTGFMGAGHVISEQTGNDTIWSVENIILGSGNNVVTASSAINVIDGTVGTDNTNTFRFLSAADADGDTIIGFKPGDVIDLSRMDADVCVAGNQSFDLVSGEAFTGRGQLMFVHENREDGEYTVVQGNTYGDNAPEFKINIKGIHDLNESNFIL